MRAMLIAFLSSLAPLTATAAIFERDLFEPGDGLLTYDDVIQREWLDLTYTLGKHLSAVTAGIESGFLRDFQFATIADIEELSDSAIVLWLDRGEEVTDLNKKSALELHSMLGNVFSIRVQGMNITTGTDYVLEHLTSFGLVASSFSNTIVDFDGTVVSLEIMHSPSEGTVRFVSNGNSTFAGLTTEPTFTQLPIARDGIGPFWLYREAVPEPSTAILSLAGAIAATSLRSRRRCF